MSGVRGRFITLEGVDGAGKSTHLDWFADALRAQGREVLVTREPGGTPVGERLREILLAEPMHPETEALLMFAARHEHLHKVILPAIGAGRWVLCDRFTDATFAYQGGGRGVDRGRLEALESWVQGGLQPDLTLLFDVPPEIARQRLAGARQPDKFEGEAEAFFRRVRQAYLDRVRDDPGRFRVIDGSRSLAEVKKALEDIIATL